MIYSLQGNLAVKRGDFIVVDVGGVGYKAFIGHRTYSVLPAVGDSVRLFSYLKVKDDGMDLYAFLGEGELHFFEKMLTVNGVGPKSAMSIMALASIEQLTAAINEGKADLLIKASGIGRKTAERVVLELRGKLAALGTAEVVRGMESDLELEEALVGLGYTKVQAKAAVSKINPKIAGLEKRLKEALKKAKFG